MAYPFVISDENLNNSGFWISTSGIDIKQFKKNPIMLWMHKRPYGWDKNEPLPIGHWENIRKEGSQLLADAVFDQNDEFAKMIENKVKTGVIRMASPGLRPMTWSDDPKILKPGQTRAALIKCILKEISIVDMGRNDNALKLYDEDGEQVNLSDNETFIPKIINKDNMKLSEKSLEVLNLTEQSTEAEVNAAIQAKLSKIGELETKLAEKDKEVLTLKDENVKLTEKFETKSKDDFKAILDDKALKLTEEQKQNMLEMFDSAGAEIANKVLKTFPKHQNLKDVPSPTNNKETQELADEWDELHKSGKLEELQAKDPERFDLLKKARYA